MVDELGGIIVTNFDETTHFVIKDEITIIQYMKESSDHFLPKKGSRSIPSFTIFQEYLSN